MNELKLDEKSTDAKAIKSALSAIGKLLYIAQTNPYLTYLSSFLASALHRDPLNAAAIAYSAMYHYQVKPFVLEFWPIKPKFLASYCDAAHSLLTCRAHIGNLTQLQETDDPEPMHNVVTFGSERCTPLIGSVYSGEVKAAELSIKAVLKVLPTVTSMYGPLKLVLFIDNKGVVQTLNGTREPHPFSSSSVDFIRQEAQKLGMIIKWIPTRLNHADI